MGGGKTHSLIAFGLLARHPDYRRAVMEAFYTPGETGPVRVVAFSGRESDAPLGIWGSIATQLGKKEPRRRARLRGPWRMTMSDLVGD
jgi:hypothetical protein